MYYDEVLEIVKDNDSVIVDDLAESSEGDVITELGVPDDEGNDEEDLENESPPEENDIPDAIPPSKNETRENKCPSKQQALSELITSMRSNFETQNKLFQEQQNEDRELLKQIIASNAAAEKNQQNLMSAITG